MFYGRQTIFDSENFPVKALSPGIIIIIGVQAQTALRLVLLYVFESGILFERLPQLQECRRKHGYGKDSRLQPGWYGDERRYFSIIVPISAACLSSKEATT
ncbi:hypothetical protein [Desulfobacula sp.]|uniref:hypothetical protein n=1 Tax=Desulfobacula sp. TaxID=2593537 RepID=UPI0026122D90|nr:hypothetical protein [Desulfobacula sp.]